MIMMVVRLFRIGCRGVWRNDRRCVYHCFVSGLAVAESRTTPGKHGIERKECSKISCTSESQFMEPWEELYHVHPRLFLNGATEPNSSEYANRSLTPELKAGYCFRTMGLEDKASLTSAGVSELHWGRFPCSLGLLNAHEVTYTSGLTTRVR